MAALRVLSALRAYGISDDVVREIEKELVRRRVYESSASVQKILEHGEALASEVSVDLWAKPLQVRQLLRSFPN